jgi:penicillin-binding protein 2
MAGKTGTSQVKRIERRGMKQELLPWEHRHHALYVGYAPVAKPKYACCVLVEHGGGGSASAAPRARDLLWKMQLLADGIETDPPTEPVKPLD